MEVFDHHYFTLNKIKYNYGYKQYSNKGVQKKKKMFGYNIQFQIVNILLSMATTINETSMDMGTYIIVS